jgi:adenosylhomocysteine nucleosidase
VNQCKWLILTALTMEAKAISSAIPALPDDTELCVVGIGAKKLTTEHCSRCTGGIILAGLAGGLDPALRVGDVVVDQPQSGPWPILPFRHGRVHTSEHLITTSTEKSELFRQTGCLVVDMESAIVRRFAETSGLPLLTIRAISDSADDALPERLLGWVDEFGRPRLGRVSRDLAGHPLQIPALIRLGRRSHRAARQMAYAVQLALTP